MSLVPEPLRRAVVQRAGERCKYCLLTSRFQVGGFELDHILPLSRGGPTALENLAFACLLVTDINTQNSLMLVQGDQEFTRRISYAHVEQDTIFDLPGVVSRKKQLIPYLSSIIKEMNTEGVTPTPRKKSSKK